MGETGDLSGELCARVAEAAADGDPISPLGGGTKAFYGEPINAAPLPLDGHRGIVNYQPTELVLSARAGTPLAEIEATLAEHRQMLPFEPPHFGAGATLGGTIACGLSGPRRPFQGAARDLVLGTRMINGRGEHLRFGGEVMKNVAGYDVSRLLTGSLGTLGVITEVSMKVLPAPPAEITLTFEHDAAAAIAAFRRWCAAPLPLSGLAHWAGRSYVRLSGTEAGLDAARARLGGEPAGTDFWLELREQRLAFFEREGALWRLSVPPASAPIALPGEQLIDWAGGLRWLASDAGADEIRRVAAGLGGHATRWRGGAQTPFFHPLPPAMLALHQRVKRALDPGGIFSPGRLYRAL